MKPPADSHYYRQVQTIDTASEDQAVRLLLFGNCQEGALFDVPEGPGDQEFFGRVTETILALANSFGGWVIFGASSSWLGGVEVPESGTRLTLAGLLETPPAWLRGETVRTLQQALGPVAPETILGEPGKSGLGQFLTASRLNCTTYSRRWARSRAESVERLLQTPFLTAYALKLPPKGSLLALRVRPLIDGELRHAGLKGGETVVRVGDRNAARANLNGINWAIYQALRLPYPESGESEATQVERFLFGENPVEMPERLRVRAQVGEFLNTLQPARRLDLAMELTSTCWKQLGDRELFRAALDILYTAELGGRYVNERFWRDHVVHTLYTLLLGIYLWNSCPPLREKLEENPQAPLIWAMTATCHDLGYPFELFVVNLLSQLKDLAPYAAKELPVLPRIKDLGKNQVLSYWQLISRQLWPELETEPPLLEIIFDDKSQNRQAHLLDHGIVSALLWLALIARINDQLLPPHGPPWVLEAAAAMAAHNLKKTDLEKAGAKGQTPKPPDLHIDRQPFAILLALCDYLQEWDRMAAARHVLIPGAVQVEVNFEQEEQQAEIIARFGLDANAAQAIGEGFHPQRGWFALGDRISLRTESFPQAIATALDENRRTATQDPWMVRDPVPEFLMKLEFAKVGTVLSGPEDAKIYLDTGNRLEKGIIDNHARPRLPGTALLVFENPGYVTDHLGHLAPGEVTLVLHENPDFDAITAAFFCQELLLRGKLPEVWKPLARYVDLADQDSLPIDWDFPSTPRGIFLSFLRTAPPRKDKTFTYRHRVRRGFMILRYLTNWLERNVQNPNAEPTVCFQDAFSRAHPFEEMQVEAGQDYDVFRDMMAQGEVFEMELELPWQPFPKDTQQPVVIKKSVLLVSPKNPRSYFFPQWAALEGYDGTLIHRKRAGKADRYWKPGVCRFGTLSKYGSLARATFWGLGHILDQKETEARLARGGPSRSTDDSKRRPPNYPNEDPWYDSREGEIPGSILAAPREGTYLTMEELEACLKDTDTWVKKGEARRAFDLSF
jgi:hypothetical protein